MSQNKRFGRTETPVHEFEPVEFDMLDGQNFDVTKFGRTTARVEPVEPIESDALNPMSNLALVEALRLRLQSRAELVDIHDPNWSKIVIQELDRMSLEGFVPPSLPI